LPTTPTARPAEAAGVLAALTEENVASFDFQGTGLVATSASPAWIASLKSAYAWHVGETDRARAFRLKIIESDAPEVPPDRPLMWSGELIEGGEGRIFETDTSWTLEIPGSGYAAVHVDRRCAEIVARPGTFKAFGFTAMTNIVGAALFCDGQQMVHGAVLRGRNGRGGMLLCAPSGAGKTTTALALAREGFIFAADDISVIRSADSGPAIWGIPNRLTIHRRTLELLPWIGPLPDMWDDHDEQGVDISNLAPSVNIRRQPPWPLAALFMLGPRASAGHIVKPLARSEALVRLARDNVSNSGAGVTPWSQRQFTRLADAIRVTPVFEVRVGPDLPALADALETALPGAEV